MGPASKPQDPGAPAASFDKDRFQPRDIQREDPQIALPDARGTLFDENGARRRNVSGSVSARLPDAI